MKVIQVVGTSGSGKTTFIESLLPRLTPLGRTAIVKHLGHHRFALAEGKDSTRFAEVGAAVSVAVDDTRSVFIHDTKDLERVLELLCDGGNRFAVLEGWKTRLFSRIVIGDLPSETCVLRNPTVEEVIASLDRFDEYFTPTGLVEELTRAEDGGRTGAILTFTGVVRGRDGDHRTEYLDVDGTIEPELRNICGDLRQIEGIKGVGWYHCRGRKYPGEVITCIAILADHRKEGFLALSRALEVLRKESAAGKQGEV
jgi:molybdopterin synthase catalytic subunit